MSPSNEFNADNFNSAFIVFSVRGVRGQGPILSYQGKQIVADRRHEGLRWALKQGTASAARLPHSSPGSLAKFAAIRRASSTKLGAVATQNRALPNPEFGYDSARGQPIIQYHALLIAGAIWLVGWACRALLAGREDGSNK